MQAEAVQSKKSYLITAADSAPQHKAFCLLFLQWNIILAAIKCGSVLFSQSFQINAYGPVLVMIGIILGMI